jgi:prevent-host-death family protein
MTTCGHKGVVVARDAASRSQCDVSSIVDHAAGEHETVITKHGSPGAVVLGYEQWRALKSARPSFASLLLSFPDMGVRALLDAVSGPRD